MTNVKELCDLYRRRSTLQDDKTTLHAHERDLCGRAEREGLEVRKVLAGSPRGSCLKPLGAARSSRPPGRRLAVSAEHGEREPVTERGPSPRLRAAGAPGWRPPGQDRPKAARLAGAARAAPGGAPQARP